MRKKERRLENRRRMERRLEIAKKGERLAIEKKKKKAED